MSHEPRGGSAFAAAERRDADPFLTVFVLAAIGGVVGVVAAARTATTPTT